MTSLIGLVTFVSCLIGARRAYGCWPWEARKTWHYTGPEIQELVREINIAWDRAGEKQ